MDHAFTLQTEILNKHMSIGFTVPFLRLISQSFAGADQVGLLTVAFSMFHLISPCLWSCPPTLPAASHRSGLPVHLMARD